MNGPQHFAEAEKLLRSCQLNPELDHPDDAATYPATEFDETTCREVNTIGNALLAAQVHATLALTSAVLDVAHTAGGGSFSSQSAWAQVTG